jgi:hypothetical protein
MHKDGAAELLEIVCPDHHAEQTERVLIGYLDEIRFFLEQDLSDDRILNHVLPRHHDPITLVEQRRVLCRYVVDLRELIDLLNGLCFARYDQRDVSPVATGSRQQVVIGGADPAGVLVILVGDVNRLHDIRIRGSPGPVLEG